MIHKMYITESLNMPTMAVGGVSYGNFKSEWKRLFSCSHKDLVELHSQSKCIGASSFVLQ